MEVIINKEKFFLPTSWAEIPRKKKRKIYKSSRLHPMAMKLALVRMYIPFKYFIRLSDLYLSDIVKHLHFIDSHNPTTLFDSITILGKKHYMCLDKMSNSTGREYVLADQYYLKFMASGSKKDLNHLCAVICRVSNRDPDLTLKNEDKRRPIVSRRQIEKSAWKWRFVPLWKKLVILSFFSDCKEYVHTLYVTYLFQEGGADDATELIDFGWNGIFMGIAENGIFGNFELVIDTKFHTLCMYLVKKKQEEPPPSNSNTE